MHRRQAAVRPRACPTPWEVPADLKGSRRAPGSFRALADLSHSAGQTRPQATGVSCTVAEDKHHATSCKNVIALLSREAPTLGDIENHIRLVRVWSPQDEDADPISDYMAGLEVAEVSAARAHRDGGNALIDLDLLAA